MKVKVTCTYCGYEVEDEIWSMANVEHMKCAKCSDPHLKIKKLDEEKIDTYSPNPYKRERWEK